MIRRLVAEIDQLSGKTFYEADFVKNAKLKLEANEE
jgi:hypothetical protein